mmetsp:Transcript_106788/g.308917  ORF Transcript_106788/g.308917 Transcript_106788/m.308917 type:complete len:214 (-) Transcript_106788:663-1304(-)
MSPVEVGEGGATEIGDRAIEVHHPAQVRPATVQAAPGQAHAAAPRKAERLRFVFGGGLVLGGGIEGDLLLPACEFRGSGSSGSTRRARRNASMDAAFLTVRRCECRAQTRRAFGAGCHLRALTRSRRLLEALRNKRPSELRRRRCQRDLRRRAQQPRTPCRRAQSSHRLSIIVAERLDERAHVERGGKADGQAELEQLAGYLLIRRDLRGQPD